MSYTRILALFAVVLLAAACSRNEKTPPEPEAVQSREDLDHFVVQDDNAGDGEVASKATRESLLKELDASLEQLAKSEDLYEAFRVAEAIEDLGKTIAPELQERVAKLPEMQRIAGWRAVWTLGSLQNDGWDKGVNGLLAIVTGEGELENRVAAAEVLGAIASVRHEKILRKALKEDVFQPEVKVQLAVALWRSSKDTYATEVLREMLGSDNDSFKIQAAVALGEINQLTADAKPILEKVAEEPTLRGRTAQRALDYERAIKHFEAVIGGTAPGMEKVERIDTKLLDSVQKMIKERYIYPDAVSGRKLLYAAASGMLDGLDPYTCLLEDNQLRDAGEIRRFEVPTLGLMLGSAKMDENREVRLTRVLSVKPGSPAMRAGIRPGDRIYRVLKGVTRERVHELRLDSSDLPDEKSPFQTLPLDEAISQFQGAKGTTLGMNIMRDGWLLSRWVHMTHEVPKYEPVSHEVLPGKIGMIHVVELNASSPASVEEALAALKAAEVKVVILDLRNCAGGSVEAATKIAGLFLPKDTLVTFSNGRSKELAPGMTYKTANDAPDTELPLTILINRGTADAGEILAGALRQHERATTVGEKSFGRAIVQELIPLSAKELKEDEREAALLLTIARFHGPQSELPYYDRGVEVDVEATPNLYEGWIYDEFDRIEESAAFEDYMNSLLSLEKAKLKSLAATDDCNWENYPGFNELYSKVKTHASKDRIRVLVREHMRKRLADIGMELNKVDLQEDEVFSAAVHEAARLSGIDLTQIPEYQIICE